MNKKIVNVLFKLYNCEIDNLRTDDDKNKTATIKVNVNNNVDWMELSKSKNGRWKMSGGLPLYSDNKQKEIFKKVMESLKAEQIN